MTSSPWYSAFDLVQISFFELCELASKPVRVVPTSGIVEGFAALLEYDPEAGADDNATSMAASARRVVAGEVTQAVRDATGPMGPIRTGDWMGLSRDGVRAVRDHLEQMRQGGALQPFASRLLILVGADAAIDRETVAGLAAEARSELAPRREATVAMSAVPGPDEKSGG